MPVIGRAGVDGLFAIAGFSGHGFQHSPAAGRILADVISGRDPQFDLAPFRFDRFASGDASAELGVV
jgi:sarcosine oxidase subunit beta